VDTETRQKKESAVWNKLAAGYDERTLKTYRRAYELSIEKTAAVLALDQRVLEIGCGTGIIALGIASSVEQVVATDISPEMITVAQEKAAHLEITNVTFHVQDGYALPFDDASFDTVLLFNAIHVVQQPDALLREAHRLLKPSGHLVSATDCLGEPVPFPTRLMLGLQKLLKLLGVIPFMWYYTQEDLCRLFEQCGLEIVETAVLHANPVNAYVLARKPA